MVKSNEEKIRIYQLVKEILIIGGGAMGSAFTFPCIDNKNKVTITEPYNEVFIKNLSSAESWRTYHHSLGNATSLKLNTSDTSFSDTGAFNSTTPTSTLFTVGNSDSTNKSGDSFVAYVFAEITGYSKFGKYYGTNSTDGAFLYTGFKPAVMILKRLDVQSNSWLILDNKRDPDNLVENYLFPSETDAEGDGGGLSLIHI